MIFKYISILGVLLNVDIYYLHSRRKRVKTHLDPDSTPLLRVPMTDILTNTGIRTVRILEIRPPNTCKIHSH